MGLNYIALGVPFFFVLIGIELVIARRLGRRVYHFSDSIGAIGCGVAQQVVVLFTGALLLAGYAYIYEHYRLLTIPKGALTWIIAFFAVDFAYYWWHRLSHRVNFLWAAHSVHHQSEEYNLSVALRQSVLTGLTVWPFYAILAALGIPPVVLAATIAFSTLYQFWIHTRLIKTLGPLEWLINTPSHHRGHHAQNPLYIDKNYGATLIVWDRLFGTFVKEAEEPVYGVTTPLQSFNPLWAQVAPWIAIGRAVRAEPRWLNKARILVKPPGWVPGPNGGYELPHAEISVDSFKAFEVPVSPGLRAYVALQFALALVATFFAMLMGTVLPVSLVAALAPSILLALVSLGALLDGRRWGAPLEVARLALAAASALALSWGKPYGAYVAAGAVLAAWASTLWLRRLLVAPGAERISEPATGSAAPLT